MATRSNFWNVNNMPLLRSLWLFRAPQPPVETGGYKYLAPTERDADGLMATVCREAPASR